MEEIFKDIPGYEGLYQVSNLGNVKSLGNDKARKEKILKQSLAKDGYFISNLSSKNNSKPIKNHQLVAMAFLGHIPCGLDIVVDHINNDKLDNRVENLQLITNRENLSKDKKNKTSKYTGVCWYKASKKWISQITINNKIIHIGYFKCEQESSEAYQNKLKELIS